MKLMVVDDNPVNRMLVCMMAEELGWDCIQAESGSSAIEQLNTTPVDTVLLDISMPVMSGETVCQIIKSNPNLANHRVIAYTAHVMPDQVSHIMHCGFDGYLPKPFSESQFLKVIEGP